ncbi:MAG: folate-binding protein [Propionibacteriaceae bacterium]|nr:folate-binding protein [Propionibacteriaceae bacterium]
MTAVVAATGPDAGLAWHLGDPLGEQRRLAGDGGVVDLSNRDVVTLAGPDRLRYLDLMTTQRFGGLAEGAATAAYFLDPQGHILCHFHAVVGDPVWGWTEPGQGKELAEQLERGKFRLAVTVEHRPDVALLWTRGVDVTGTLAQRAGVDVAGSLDVRSGVDLRGVDVAGTLAVRSGDDSLGGSEVFWPRARLAEVAPTAGTWAYEALRVAAGLPRVGVDTDHRTLPNELGVPSPALVLDKGCYPGQETVAKVYNLGRPPRRLTGLHLDGSLDTLPEVGAEVVWDGKPVGRMGSSERHYLLGPIGLALLKRDLPLDAQLEVSGIPAVVS